MPIAVIVDGLFFPQREALGLDPRESTPGFKRQLMILNGEIRSLKRVSIVMQHAFGLEVSPNTVDRITLEVGDDLQAAEQEKWKMVLKG